MNKRYADEKQEALYDRISKYQEEALHLLAHAERNENDGRALISLAKAQVVLLTAIEGRIRDVEEEIIDTKTIHTLIAKDVGKLTGVIVTVFAVVLVASVWSIWLK